jgi:hypothetical protein
MAPARAVCAQRDHHTCLRHIVHGDPDITERGNGTSPPSKSARGGGLDQLARGADGGLSVATRPPLSSALGLDQAPAARHSVRTPGQPPSTSGAIPFWLTPPQDQAAGLVRAEPRLDYASVRHTLEALRDGSEAPAAAAQRNAVMAMCRGMLAEVVGGHPIACVQADAASSLAVSASRIAQVTTWSLSDDSEMVDKPEEVRETTLDPQVQMWYGSERGRLVLTGMASVVLQWMMGSQNLDSAAGRFHALDVVPVSSLHTNEKNANGTYKESPNMAALETRCAPETLGFFVGNLAYAIIILQGAMGARNLNKLCAQRKIELTVASEAVYKLFGMQRSDVAFTATDTFGLRLLNRGKQIVLLAPSLGSTLAGPASGGGGDAVISVTGIANVVRALRGYPPIAPEESPLLALTTGEGRSAGQLARLAELMGVRGKEGWLHPSQRGGKIGGEIEPRAHPPAHAPRPPTRQPPTLTSR